MLLIASLAFLLCTSCEKTNVETEPEVVIGSVKVNGIQYDLYESNCFILENFDDEIEFLFGLSLSKGTGDEIIFFGGVKGNAVGTYTYNSGKMDGQVSYLGLSAGSKTEIYEFYTAKATKMTFTSVDLKGAAEGTFEAYGKSPSGKTIALTEGKFKLVF